MTAKDIFQGKNSPESLFNYYAEVIGEEQGLHSTEYVYNRKLVSPVLCISSVSHLEKRPYKIWVGLVESQVKMRSVRDARAGLRGLAFCTSPVL